MGLIVLVALLVFLFWLVGGFEALAQFTTDVRAAWMEADALAEEARIEQRRRDQKNAVRRVVRNYDRKIQDLP